ncbi:NlpC/P60 family protein [Sporosarcina sp. NPDC096371]|uniref:C40 family peptidase n=1 Tax=Sporosarcina sp. NPDC096371 TaxID=3364530 RepID=UPI0037FF2D1C
MRNKFIMAVIVALLFTMSPFTKVQQASAATPNDITTYAKKYLGVPYVFGGTTTSGFDCSGFIRFVFQHFDIDLPRTSAEQYKSGTAVAKSDLQPGDIVFFSGTYKSGISHSGIYLGNDQFISAENKGVAIANLKTNSYWSSKYTGARRLPTAPAKPVTNSEFKDVDSAHPAFQAIVNLNTNGIISGFPNKEFRPDAQVNRGQAAAMINRVLKLETKSNAIFTDVGTTHSFAKDIAAMNEAGILAGYENGRFGVEDPLTKAQLAVILERAFKMVEATEDLVKTASLYTDVPSTYWAYDSIVALKVLDKTSLFQTKNFSITANATRAEFSAALYSAMPTKSK